MTQHYKVQKIWENSIFGIPYKFKDFEDDTLHFRNAFLNVNAKGLQEFNPRYTGDTISYQLNINFNREIHLQHFYSYIDAISKLGGLVASIGPLLGILTPLFVLNYVIRMMKIVRLSNRS